MGLGHVSARGWRRLHGWATIVFFALWGVAVLTGWIDSVKFVSHVSMLALVYAGVSAWQSGRAEVKIDENGN